MDFSTRYDFLKTNISRYDGYYNLAAVKASLLLTSNAIFLAPALGQKSDFLGNLAGTGATPALIAAAAIFSLVSITYSALVIASRLGRRRDGDFRSRMFSGSVATTDVEAYVDDIAVMDESAILDDLSRVAHLLAGDITRKFRYVNASLLALLGAIVCACVATII